MIFFTLRKLYIYIKENRYKVAIALLASFYTKSPIVYCDIPEKAQMGFQDPASPIMEGIIDLHHYIFFIGTIVIVFVAWMLIIVFYYDGLKFLFDFNNFSNKTFFDKIYANLSFVGFLSKKLVIYNFFTKNIRHAAVLEFIWTILPALILITIVVPSFVLLYSMDEIIEPCISLKVEGHQWYWSYSIPEFPCFDTQNESSFCPIEFDSYMLVDSALSTDQLRLLETDFIVYLPVNLNIRILITASDVLHCWAIPSLGIKMDAVPGRLNQVITFIKRVGTFYGQCSELCGVNHGFMPITLKAVSYKDYLVWLLINSES